MTPDDFKKRYGYKKTVENMYIVVAEAEAAAEGRIPADCDYSLAIKKSCLLVDAARRVGGGRQFFVATALNSPSQSATRKLDKKRPPSR